MPDHSRLATGKHTTGQTGLLLALACGLVLALGGGVAQATTSFGEIGQFGTPGSGDGEFGGSSPQGVAVAESGAVWVTDGGNARVQKFGSSLSGEFLFTFGWGVQNGAAEFEICTSLTAPCQNGISGSGEGQFSRLLFGFLALPDTGLAVAPTTGDVYVADTANNRVEKFSSSGSYLSKFNGSATPAEFNEPTGVSVAPTTGDVYVMDSGDNVVDRFSATGTYECQITGKTPGSATECNGKTAGSKTPQEGLSTVEELTANLAVDSSGDLYVADRGQGVVDEFNPAGAYLKQFSVSEPSAVAVDSLGDVFVSSERNKIVEFEPSGTKLTEFGSPEIGNAAAIAVIGSGSGERVYIPDADNSKVWIFGPVVTPTCSTGTPPSSLTATSATVPGTINPEGIKASYQFEYGTSESYGAKAAEVISWEGDEGTELKGVSESLTGLQPHQTYDYQLVASNTHGGSLCGNQTLETLPEAPTISGERAGSGSLTQTGATPRAEVNPNNETTHWHFEYSTEPSLIGATSVPSPEEEIAASYGNVPTSQPLSPLAPNTTYYYRAVASNTGGGTRQGTIESFLTLPVTPTTGNAAGIAQSTATVAGSFNPGGHDTHWYFEFGTAACGPTSCGEETTEEDGGAGTSLVEPKDALTKLEPLTTYHYRLVVANSSGPAYGPEQEVTTLPQAPAVITDPPASVTTSSATVGGEVVPQCVEGRYPPTTYHFEYGTTTAYGAGSEEAAVEASSCATGGEVVRASLAGLLPNTVYHYRLDATNSGGETQGGDRTFTTNAEGEPGTGPPPPGFSLTQTGTPLGNPTPLSFPSLTTLGPLPPAKPSSPSEPKPLTKQQKLEQAIRLCRKDKSKRKRLSCEKSVKAKYGTKTKASKKK